MSSTIGENIKLSIFGESHGEAIGAVIDGFPAGVKLDFDEIDLEMARRAPGKDKTTTARKESDKPEIVSGVYNGVTTGAPIAAFIKNSDAHSSDYPDLARFPRPGHADFTATARYDGFSDYRGGGHFSGRLTAPMVFAGALCKEALKNYGVTVGAHLYSVGSVNDTPFDAANITAGELNKLSLLDFAVVDKNSEAKMREEIEKARLDCDSIGAVIECAAVGFPKGIGSPIFDGVENRLAAALFGIPAVKGIEFGAGFAAAKLYGSENNDSFTVNNGEVKTKTNNHGGILGGITSGMPIIFRLAFKPTPSIFKEQTTVDLKNNKETTLTLGGRHDPCVAVRAVPAVEALTAFCLLDLLIGGKNGD